MKDFIGRHERWLQAVAGSLAAACLFGWFLYSSWLNPEARFERIHVGMTMDDVRAIVGEPTEGAGDNGWYVWNQPPYMLDVWFKDGKVTGVGWRRNETDRTVLQQILD